MRGQIVYVDILLGINLLIGYFLLLLTARFAGAPAKRGRLLLAAVLAALYALIIFAPRLVLPLDLLIKALLGLSITAAAFGIKNKRQFLRAYCIFMVSTFLFGGIFSALFFLLRPQGMLVNNGTVYFDFSVLELVIYTIVAYLGMTLVHAIAKRRAPRSLTYRVTIGFGGRAVTLDAVVDTGNSLRETFSQYPAAVCGLADINELLPLRLREIMQNNRAAEAMAALSASEFSGAVRLIPYRDVSGEGMLFAFKPDSFILEQDNTVLVCDRVYVGIALKQMTRLDYACILNPQIIEYSTEKRSARCYES